MSGGDSPADGAVGDGRLHTVSRHGNHLRQVGAWQESRAHDHIQVRTSVIRAQWTGMAKRSDSSTSIRVKLK